MSHKNESARDHVRFNEISFMSDDPGFDRFDSEFDRICFRSECEFESV